MSNDVLREVVLPKLEGVRKQGGYFMARCPAHQDNQASLSLTVGKDHPVLLNCHAGCERDLILEAMGLTWDELCAPREERLHGEWTPFGDALAVYDYVSEGGDLLFQVVRAPGKRFLQRRPDAKAKSGWTYKLGETRKVLYRLPKVIAARDAGEMIYIPEGEKDVHALEATGLTATCNPGGAGKWLTEFSEVLRDAIVIIIADKDDPGYAHARQIAASLKGVAAAIEIWEAAVGKDPSEHFAAGKSAAEFVPIWQDGDPPADLGPDLNEFLQVQDPPRDFILGDLLERGERLMLTGIEGHGKSTLTRQIGVCAAAGWHPFWGHAVTPHRVLFIDCENSERQSRREFRPMVKRLEEQGTPIAHGMFRIIHRPRGVDLATSEGAAWLMERVTAHEPDLLILGPLYKLHVGDLNEELSARIVVSALDAVRDKADCGLIIEAHSPHGDGRARTVRPAGSSLFLRYPEFGFGIQPAAKADPHNPSRFELRKWRGSRDRGQRWPRFLHPGIPGGLPWIAEPEGEAWA